MLRIMMQPSEMGREGLYKGAFGSLIVVLLLVGVFVGLRNDWRIPNASGVVTSSGLMAYWDSACKRPVSSVDWGNVTVGTLSRVVIYVKSSVQSPLMLSMNTSGWDPLSAAQGIFLTWDGTGKVVQPGSVVKVTLGLYVSPYAGALKDFSFLISIGVGYSKSADINGNGAIDVSDFALLALSWNSVIGSGKYSYSCDFNNDGRVNVSDIAIFVLQRNAE